MNLCFISSAPSRAPDLVTAYNTSSTSLVVKWSHVQRQYFQGKPIGYMIIYYPVGLQSDLNFVSVKDTTNTATLTELNVYTEYAIKVSAVSLGGKGPGKWTFASTGAKRLIFLPC